MKLARFPISTLLDSASGHLEAHLQKKRAQETATQSASPSQYAGIIFSGNPHETVPRKLLLDNRLTPLERNCWQVFRLLVNEDGVTAFPTYDQLRPYLGMNPGKHASRETVSKALTVLRLTRWLSLGRRVRNEVSGQVQGNVYLLHDEPVTPAEAIEFDKDYMQLLLQSMEHQNKVIKEVAEISWREFTGDPDVGRRLPTHVDTIAERLNGQAWAVESKLHALPAPEFGIRTQYEISEASLSSDSELSANPAKQGALPLSSESELSGNSPSTPTVRNPNSYSTYTDTHKDVCKSSVLPAGNPGNAAANWLIALEMLSAEHRSKARSIMQTVPDELREPVMGQWAHRCIEGEVSKPMAYLSSLATRAIRGDFNADWQPSPQLQPKVAQAQPAPPTPPVIRPQSPPSQAGMQTAKSALSTIWQQLKPRQGGSPTD